MKKFRMMAVLCTVFLLAFSFTTVAYAGGGEKIPEPTAAPAPEPTRQPNPFTPAGSGTVVDNATGEDGKEFYTITTPDENVFYLVIDRQREQENVYFLNAVTEKDLLALAEKSGKADESPAPTQPVAPKPEPTSEPTPAPEPEKSGNMGMLIFVVLAVLAGGGAGYYFKIYRPKQEQAASADDDYSEYEDDPYAVQEDDTPPWDEDESAGDGEA